jgi:hypothetical protein
MFMLLVASLLVVETKFYGQSNKTKPDLTGTWVLDRSKSSRAINFDEALTVEHHDPEIKITRRITANGSERVETLTCYSNGRGEVNPSELTGKPVKTKTKWDGNKLVSQESSITRVGDRTVYVDVTDVWQLSADGCLLMHKTLPKMRPLGNAMIMPEGDVNTNRVFVRGTNWPSPSP